MRLELITAYSSFPSEPITYRILRFAGAAQMRHGKEKEVVQCMIHSPTKAPVAFAAAQSPTHLSSDCISNALPDLTHSKRLRHLKIDEFGEVRVASANFCLPKPHPPCLTEVEHSKVIRRQPWGKYRDTGSCHPLRAVSVSP